MELEEMEREHKVRLEDEEKQLCDAVKKIDRLHITLEEVLSVKRRRME